MKRRTLWKIVAAFCMVAMLLPAFSGLTFTPATAESDSTPPAPLPYALEFLNQEHPKMYLTDSDIEVDGVKNDSEDYVLLTEKTDGDDNSSGIFSGELNPTTVGDVASEVRPKYLRIYGNYDENGMNFYIEAKSRTHISGAQSGNQSLLKLWFGTNFAETAASANLYLKTDVNENPDAYNFQYTFNRGADEMSGEISNTTYHMTKKDNAETVSDSTGDYGLTEASYEVHVPWSAVGVSSSESLDRLYFQVNYYYFTGSTSDNGATNDYNYWFYGLPYNAVINQKVPTTLNAVYEADYSEDLKSMQMSFPHVLEFVGEKPAAVYANTPTLSTEKNVEKTADGYSLEIDYALTADSQVEETGVLYGNTADIKNKNLVLKDGASKHTFTLTDGKATVEHSFAVADYDTFVSFRPYVKYTDGTVIYGEYFTTSPNYLYRTFTGFEKEINVLMIGCSFNYYYLDELVSMAAADNIKINAHKAYYSGNPAASTWNWLIHDAANWQQFQHDYLNPSGKLTNKRTLKQILEGGDKNLTWDFISVQDHYDPYSSRSYDACMKRSLPYLANTFRYLEATEPQATLLLHETWAYDANHKAMAALNATQQTVTAHQKNITDAIYKMSESIPAHGTVGNYENMPIVPSGAAWSYARNGVTIDDVLYKIEGTLTMDAYHDGETQGGQFLNACVWYEVLTGNSCLGNNWRPTGYSLDESRALALQQIAHQAVADLYGADYATGIPEGRA